MVGGAIGYAHESGFRGEIALDYRQHDVDSLTVTSDRGFGVGLGVGSLQGLSTGASGLSTSGDVSSFAGMVNGYYSFNFGLPIMPYVGAGVGLANISADIDLSVPGVTVNFVDDSDTVFAYQGMAGITYEINPAVSVGIGYSYFATEDPELSSAIGGFDSEYETHNFMLNVRFSTYPSGAFGR